MGGKIAATPFFSSIFGQDLTIVDSALEKNPRN
jgi:hypothetical protein